MNDKKHQHKLEKMREWRQRHPNYGKDYARRLRADPEYRKKQALYYKKWYQEGNGRKRSVRQIEAARLWNQRNPDAVVAKCELHKALKMGLLIKDEKCFNCRGEDKRLNGHHFSYKKPLIVVWLCASCHKLLHEKIKRLDREGKLDYILGERQMDPKLRGRGRTDENREETSGRGTGQV